MVNKFSVKKQNVSLTLYYTAITTFIPVLQLNLRLDFAAAERCKIFATRETGRP